MYFSQKLFHEMMKDDQLKAHWRKTCTLKTSELKIFVSQQQPYQLYCGL